MVNTGLLVLTSPVRAKKLLPVIKKHVLKTLYIQYFPERNIFISGTNLLSTQKWRGHCYAQTVANIYEFASSISSRLDVRVLLSNLKNSNISIIHTKRPVELVIFDQAHNKKEADAFIQDYLSNTSMGCNFITIDENCQEKSSSAMENDCDDNEQNGKSCEEKFYKNCILGGTFDRLHNGHKILLSEAILYCSEKLTVGVTDENMLKSKILWELIEPCEQRIKALKDFLEDVDSSLKYNLVAISDIYGPTKDDPKLNLLVVSEETVRGGEKVNQLRKERNLSQLDIHVVKLMSDEQSDENEDPKISSSNERIRLLGTRLRQTNLKDKTLRPYIIGLTGGIASGKSSIAEKLEKLGAGHVNCDKIAHDLYEPGKECYKLIVENFGTDILNSERFIDRKALGNIVFNNKEQLNKLNKLVWPAILKEAKMQMNSLHEKGVDIIVMEAAVLIQANWQNYCHEIWTCIIPEEEAVKRVMERNSLSEDEAKQRITVQPSNVQQINEANVVVSTLWSHEVTQKQVQKAWNELMNHLKEIPDS